MQSHQIIVCEENLKSDIQQEIIKNADFLIGARYHSIVFALNNNTPFVALSYEHKITGLLQTLDKTDSMIDILDMFHKGTIDFELRKIEKLLSTLSDDTLAYQKAKQISKHCFECLTNYMSSKSIK